MMAENKNQVLNGNNNATSNEGASAAPLGTVPAAAVSPPSSSSSITAGVTSTANASSSSSSKPLHHHHHNSSTGNGGVIATAGNSNPSSTPVNPPITPGGGSSSSSSSSSSSTSSGMIPLPRHPLDMLTVEELKVAAATIKRHFGSKLGKTLRFARIDLKEPDRRLVVEWDSNPKPGAFPREAFAVVIDPSQERVYEVVVNLFPRGSETVLSSTLIPGVQPGFLSDEYEVCEIIVKKDPRVKEALRRRGITDISTVMVDAWTSFFSHPKERMCNPLLFVRANDSANGYDRPVDGLDIFVDMNKMEVTEVKDLFHVPVPHHDPIAQWQNIKRVRTDLKPLHIVQPEGPSFTVDGHHVYWQNWHFRVGFTQWEGLVLHQLQYYDPQKGKVRPVIYRASVAEMVVPYGDPRSPNYRKNAFDGGEDGLGRNAHSLELGCDCVGTIYYFDAQMVDSKGQPYKIKNAICMHEEDHGTLWKHKDWRTGIQETRRARRLVISYFATVANYDYGFYWYLSQDGTIQCEAKLTGILSTSAISPGDHPGGYGTMIAPNLYAPIHQHFFIARLDMQVDGFENSVYEVNVQTPEPHEYNPYKSAFYAVKTPLKTELEAARVVNPESARLWKIVNNNSKNRNGEPCGWKIHPSCNATAFASPESKVMQRAGFLKKSIWVTPYHPDEKYPGGSYVYQKEHEDGLTKWTMANRSIENTDLVVWYTFGVTHVVRAEDWPVMPAEHAGFQIKPDNFFDYSPAMDVPPLPSKHNKKECCSVDVTPRSKL